MTSIQETIKVLQDQADSCISFLANPCLCDQPCVVGRDGLWVSDLEVVDGKTTGKHSITSNATKAQRFTRANAEIIANTTQNGNGFFKVQSKAAAVQECLESTKLALSMFNKVL